MEKLFKILAKLFNKVIYVVFIKSSLGQVGKNCQIDIPILVNNLNNVYIGNNVRIRPHSRLETVTKYNNNLYNPKVYIGNDVTIEQGFHLACAEEIIIQNNVAITEYVCIFDILHSYDVNNKAIRNQNIKSSKVFIGEGTLLGCNSVIQPGVSIGKFCIIGANSVVTKSIPDNSVAVGVPAKVINRNE